MSIPAHGMARGNCVGGFICYFHDIWIFECSTKESQKTHILVSSDALGFALKYCFPLDPPSWSWSSPNQAIACRSEGVRKLGGLISFLKPCSPERGPAKTTDLPRLSFFSLERRVYLQVTEPICHLILSLQLSKTKSGLIWHFHSSQIQSREAYTEMEKMMFLSRANSWLRANLPPLP